MIYKILFVCFLCLLSGSYNSQKTIVFGSVKDQSSNEPIPYAKVSFVGTKIGALTDYNGNYRIETYYPSDSLVFFISGYKKFKKEIVRDHEQLVNVTLDVLSKEFDVIEIKIPDELSSIKLHKKLIENKRANNKEKLDAYQYDVYSKTQFDLNNIGNDFNKKGLVKKLDFLVDYLDSTNDKESYLPLILSESYSSFYFNNNPRQKKEVIQASRITGIENIQLNQFFGEMYLDVNLYDNIINLFNRGFISPASNFATNFYKFVLVDSSFIDDSWCYKMTFSPKRTGDLTLEGEMWINDTTYALKLVKAKISPGANLNYINDLYFEHHFKKVQKEVWMLFKERIIADVKLTKKSKVYGFFAKRYSSRSNYVINKKLPQSFYNQDNSVNVEDGSGMKNEEYWKTKRPEKLSPQEKNIGLMIDSLNNTPFFKSLKNTTYFATTGYFPISKIEIGDAFQLMSVNPVERFRVAFALRTSNNFSRKIELGGNIAYGFEDKRFKYGGKIRYNISNKKRSLLSIYYKNDIEQVGQSINASEIGSSFSTVFNTAPYDKLTFVNKRGFSLENDIKKDIVLFNSFEWKEYEPLGLANYTRHNLLNSSIDTVDKITTAEFSTCFRWTKGEEFISGAFDRVSLRSKYPIFSIRGVFGVKGILGSEFDYQKLELDIQQNTQIGVLGRIMYGFNVGYIFGETAYPFLKLHEGSQSYWLFTRTSNKLAFMEFISDQYISSYIENHWDGLLFDRIPLVNKLKFRLVTSAKFLYGSIRDEHEELILIPDFVNRFGKTPYVEVNIGIENIFKLIRVDLIYRATHQLPGESPFGVRFKYAITF